MHKVVTPPIRAIRLNEQLDEFGKPSPFVFVSYCHEEEDRQRVYHDLSKLQEAGYRIWYDEGIEFTADFGDEIANAISLSSFFVVFVSPRAIKRQFIYNEVCHALDCNKQCLVVYLDQTELQGGLKLHLGPRQAAMRFSMPWDDYFAKLTTVLPPATRRIPTSLPPNPIDDYEREITIWLESNTECPDEPLLELATALGIGASAASQTITSVRDRLGITEQARIQAERLRQAVRILLMRGPLATESHRTIANLAASLGLAPQRADCIVLDEVVQRARQLSDEGAFDFAQKVLASAAGKALSRSEAARRLMQQLEEKLNRSAPAVHSRQNVSENQAIESAPESEETATTKIPDNLAIRWVRIPAGLFKRGCPTRFIEHIMRKFPNIRNAKDILETFPERREPLDEFWIGLTPITNSQFHAFVHATHHIFPAGWVDRTPPYPQDAADKPVTGVTWQDAVGFANWLGARLPARSEYEKACRGFDGLIFPWGNDFDATKCNTAESGRDETLPVGSIPEGASPFGVLDLVGNVWQWAQDGAADKRMSVGASFGWQGEIFGAGFFDLTRSAESSENDLGFRVACGSLVELNFPCA